MFHVVPFDIVGLFCGGLVYLLACDEPRGCVFLAHGWVNNVSMYIHNVSNHFRSRSLHCLFHSNEN